jgi:hypothetical protein
VPQTQHTISVSTPQHGGTGTRYVFHKWSDGVTQVSRTVTAANANTLYEAMFGKQYLLTVTANPSNGGAVSGAGWHNAGTTVTVQATANTGFAFTGFSGGLTGTANPQLLVMTKRYNVVANFAPAAVMVNAP